MTIVFPSICCPISGIIGARSKAKAVAGLLATTHVPQISLCAKASELGNRTAYPNFFRILPDESKQIMVQQLFTKLCVVNPNCRSNFMAQDIHMSPNRKEGGHIAFGADPVGVGVAYCLHSIS